VRRLAGGLVLACALAAAGGAFASTTPAQYRARTTAICSSTSKRLDALKPPTKKSEIGAYFESALPIVEGQWKALRKLDPPSPYRYLHLRILGFEKQEIDGVSKLIDRIGSGVDAKQAFDSLDKSLSPVGVAETAAWNKLRVPACADLTS
jgi:hypothetical protein